MSSPTSTNNPSLTYTEQQILERFSVFQVQCGFPNDEVIESVLIDDIQPPVCYSYTPPTSDINPSPFAAQNKPHNKAGLVPRKTDRRNKKAQKPESEFTADISDCWYYRDNTGKIMGPFAANTMRDWLGRGYISIDLVVRMGEDEPFKPISEIFPSKNYAFRKEDIPKKIQMQKPRRLNIEKQGIPQSALYSLQVTSDDELQMENWEKLEQFAFD